ncbi:hypothetical protein J132_07122 [Termitomyces sp. J132]|nr:hypothetical protein H2248_010532 [Termitomyces sp. 'cryptogamus']KNZ80132.1 hypothetical protein J132_07122 [Termitomyces sp. J132]
MPNVDHNNVHSVEFEAPLSSDSIALAKKHFSIDLSLELERQLDMESFPPTPAHYRNGSAGQEGDVSSSHDSLDPQILAHIVKQLQHTLAEVTRDRDELQKQIVLSHSHEAELQDALQHMIDKATAMDVELTDAKKKIKDDEEAIVLLRAKVEESRRGLMRIQAESRRQSLAPVDVIRAGIASFGSSPSAKRGTFTTMTGSFTARPGHRRIVSVNDFPINSGFDKTANPPTFTFPDDNASSVSPSSSRRHSNLLGRTSPSQLDVAPGHGQSIVQVEALRQELRLVKNELEQTKHELNEVNEAREASEICVKVLREFIGENNVGAVDPDTASVTSLKLPPPPTMSNGDADEEVAFQSKKTVSATSWGFGKLWGDSTAKTYTNVPQSTTLAPPHVTPSLSTAPLSRKIGDFFTSRTSSTGSISFTPARPVPSVVAPSIRESVHSASDVSSVVEPASPLEEYNTIVVIRDVTNLSDPSAGNSPDLDKEMKTQS